MAYEGAKVILHIMDFVIELGILSTEECQTTISLLKKVAAKYDEVSDGDTKLEKLHKGLEGCINVDQSVPGHVKIEPDCDIGSSHKHSLPAKSYRVDPSLVQIKADNKEMDRRISAFIEKKQLEWNDRNRLEFFMRTDSADSCARTDAVYPARQGGGTSHVKVSQVFNPYGPQLRPSVSNSSAAPSGDWRQEVAAGVEERLHNMEAHLQLSRGEQTSVFERLRVLEDRMLQLESLSPEYFADLKPTLKRQRLDRPAFEKYEAPIKQDMTIDQIDDQIKLLKEKLMQRNRAGSHASIDSIGTRQSVQPNHSQPPSPPPRLQGSPISSGIGSTIPPIPMETVVKQEPEQS